MARRTHRPRDVVAFTREIAAARLQLAEVRFRAAQEAVRRREPGADAAYRVARRELDDAVAGVQALLARLASTDGSPDAGDEDADGLGFGPGARA